MTTVRRQFAQEFGYCMRCLDEWKRTCLMFGLQTHEIARGVHRKEAVKHRATMLRLCELCHDTVSRWPIAAQLALKRMRDPEHYDRVLVNRIRGRQPEAVTELEVDQAEQQLLDDGLSRKGR